MFEKNQPMYFEDFEDEPKEYDVGFVKN